MFLKCVPYKLEFFFYCGHKINYNWRYKYSEIKNVNILLNFYFLFE